MAGPLERSLKIGNTELALLVSLPLLLAALCTIPIGAVSDRMPRIRLLAGSIVLWSLAMIASGASVSFEMLLISRLFLGGMQATSGPTLFSLGRFALWEGILPHGAAPPLHSHPQDETFYVLDGDLTVWVVEPELAQEQGTSQGWLKTRARTCRAGAAAFAPAGTPHTFRIDSDTARVLFLSTPAGIEDYVRALAEPARWAVAPATRRRAARFRRTASSHRARARRHPTCATTANNQRSKGGTMSMSTQRAVLVRAGEAPAVRWGPDGVIRILAGAESTDRSFSIVETIEQPGSAAPLHVHHGEAEAFYILEGAIELTCGEETVTAGAGDFVYAPKNVPHKYAVAGEQPAKVLLMFSRPGFESFFAEAGAPLDEEPAGPPDLQAFQRIVESYDMELLETPGH